MVIRDIVFVPSAQRRLRKIYDYIHYNQSQQKAETFREGIYDKADLLMGNAGAGIGQEEPNFKHLNLGHRYLRFGKYKIIYRVFKDIAYVTDIFHTSQDPNDMQA